MNPDIGLLLDKVKSGETLSFDSIFRLYHPLILSMTKDFLSRFSLPESELDDIVQEASIALYNATLAYDPTKGVSFGLFAKICIKNRIVSYIRRHHGNGITSESLENVEDILSGDAPEQLVINRESLSDLNQRINGNLTDFEKSVFWLYLADMSYSDIAKALSKPKKSVDNAINRIKAKLRKLL